MKAVLTMLAVLLGTIAWSQDVIFITELELDYVKKEYNNALIRVPYEEFKNEYDLEFFYMDDHGNVTSKKVKVTMSENTVYNSDPFITPSALLFMRIQEPITNGTVKMNARILTHSKRELVGSKDITLSTQNISPKYYLDQNMYWTPQSLKIGFPEEVALNIATKHILTLISPESISGYYKVIHRIKASTQNVQKINQDPGSVEELYKFKIFAAPYLKNTFLENEKLLLLKEINVLKNSNQDVNKEEKLNIKSSVERKQKILAQYEKVISELNTYSIEADALIDAYQRDKYSAVVDTPQQSHARRAINIAFGVNAAFPLKPVDNVTVSLIDTTIRFEPLDKINVSIAGGVLIEPFKKQNINLTFGLFFLYYLNGNNLKPYKDSNLGAGLGVGTNISNIDILLTMGFRKTRVPHPFFIDKYKEEPQHPPAEQTEIDYNDDSLFIDKNIINYGLTFAYRF